MTTLVTGGTGFVGRALVARLSAHGAPIRLAVRAPVPNAAAPTCVVGDIAGDTSWRDALDGVDTVVHLAGRAHTFGRGPEEALAFDRVNVHGTAGLVRAAAAAGVRRFVFLSSAKVAGEQSPEGRPLREDDPPAPVGPYPESKWRAEQIVRDVAGGAAMEWVVVRTPLVYGPGVRANFLSLMRAVDRGVPLPFGRVRNSRSLIFVDNLVDALVTCLTHPDARGATYFVKDAEDLSTAALVERLAASLGVRARLLPVPVIALRAAAALTGRRLALQKVCGSLVVDASRIRRELGWTPPIGVDDALEATARSRRWRSAGRSAAPCRSDATVKSSPASRRCAAKYAGVARIARNWLLDVPVTRTTPAMRKCTR
jgi:nucleoside-diphosphate-sugar epimerase